MNLIERLRNLAEKYGPADPERGMCFDAADEIARLKDALAHAEKALAHATDAAYSGLNKLRQATAEKPS